MWCLILKLEYWNWHFIVTFTKEDTLMYLNIANVRQEHVLTSTHVEKQAYKPASVSLSLSLSLSFSLCHHFDAISPTQPAISSSLRRKKKKKVKGSPHLDFHSGMSSMEFSRKANPSNSVKRTVWVCVFSIKKDYSITKTDPVWKASSEYTVW